MNKFVNNRLIHEFAVQPLPKVELSEPYDWQKYVDSVKALSPARRICAFPYMRLVAALANNCAKRLHYLETLNPEAQSWRYWPCSLEGIKAH